METTHIPFNRVQKTILSCGAWPTMQQDHNWKRQPYQDVNTTLPPYQIAYVPLHHPTPNSRSDHQSRQLPYSTATRPIVSPYSPLGEHRSPSPRPPSPSQYHDQSQYPHHSEHRGVDDMRRSAAHQAGSQNRLASPMGGQRLHANRSQHASHQGNTGATDTMHRPVISPPHQRRQADVPIDTEPYMCESCYTCDCGRHYRICGICICTIFRLLLTTYLLFALLITTFIITLVLVVVHLFCLILVCWPTTYFTVREHLTGGIYNLLSNIFTLLFPFWWVRTVTDFPIVAASGGESQGTDAARYAVPYTPKRTLIMCNHLSNADGMILRPRLFSWPAKFTMKRSLLNIPVIGWSFFLAGDPTINFVSSRSSQNVVAENVESMMNRCLSLLNNAVPVCVFPEGTRSRTGRLQMFKQGFFKLAIDHHIDVLPMVLHGSQHAWPPGSVLPQPACVSISYGSPITARQIASKKMTVESLMQEVREQMIQLLKSSPGYDPLVERPISSLDEQLSVSAPRGRKTLL
eukprot:GHVN01055652.1.p1 GENE.GHVN01055652.1~~GHVN01055652.1.p1  ORF type:complete len:518 (-),score=14.49 GHVN01055652.1:1816-3369(-)